MQATSNRQLAQALGVSETAVRKAPAAPVTPARCPPAISVPGRGSSPEPVRQENSRDRKLLERRSFEQIDKLEQCLDGF
jgi:hypothetical protein